MAKKWSDFRKKLLRDGHITEEGVMLAEIKLRLAELFYDLRQKKKMSQQKLAKAVGVSQPYIAKIEDGEENLTLETIVKLLAALNTCLQLRPANRGKGGSIFRILKAA